MKHRLITMAGSILVVAIVGASAAVAADQYGGHGHGGPTAKKRSNDQRERQRSQRWMEAFGDTSASRLSWTAYLTGEAEVGPNGEEDAGDPRGKGTATFLVAGRDTACYGFNLFGVTDAPSVVHIHRGAAGTNGPPVVTFNNAPKNDADQPSGDPGASSGCKVATDPAEIEALGRIRQNMRNVAKGKAGSNYYVNIHTAEEFKEGAVRGQLSPMWFDNQP